MGLAKHTAAAAAAAAAAKSLQSCLTLCNPIDAPGWGDPLEKEMATHSSILAENPMDRGGWWATGHGVTENGT